MEPVVAQTTFFKIVSFTLAHEGGFVNHPDDRGGPTKFGITQATLSEFRGRGASVTDVEELTEDEALKIYADRYWNAGNFARITSQRTALIAFDFGVMAGPRTAVIVLQRVLNEVLTGVELKVDGVLGDKTAGAVRAASEPHLNRRLIQAVQEYLMGVSRYKGNEAFALGWLRRTHRVWDRVEQWAPKLESLASQAAG